MKFEFRHPDTGDLIKIDVFHEKKKAQTYATAMFDDGATVVATTVRVDPDEHEVFVREIKGVAR